MLDAARPGTEGGQQNAAAADPLAAIIQEQTFARTQSPTAHCVADHVRCMGRSDRP